MSEKLSQLISSNTKKEFFCIKSEEVCDIILAKFKEQLSADTAQKRAIKELSIAAFKRIKTIIFLIKDEYIEDALIIWRSLYELENILTIIFNNKKEVADEYYRFRMEKDITKEQTLLQMNIRNKKRISKISFRNYGWIHKAEGYTIETMISFSGIEQLASLDRKDDYNLASEYTHAIKYNSLNDELVTPLMKALSRTFCNLLTMIEAQYEIKSKAVNTHRKFMGTLLSEQ